MTNPTPAPSAEALADKLEQLFAACKEWPETDWPDGPKFMALLQLRNLAPEAIAALRSSAPAAPASAPADDELREEIAQTLVPSFAEASAPLWSDMSEDEKERWRFLASDFLPIINRRLATERERADKAEADNRNLHLTIARISAALEITAYEQAHGKETSQIVADLRERLADIGRERNKERDAMKPTHGFMLRSLTDDGLRSLTDDGVLAYIKNRALRLSEVAELARRPTFSIRVSGALMLDARRLLDEACEELSRRFGALAPDGEG